MSLTQSIFQSSSILVMTLSGLVGLTLEADKSWTTLPITVISVGTATVMIPASIHKKIRAKKGFMVQAEKEKNELLKR